MAFLRSGCGQPGTFDHGSVSGEKRCGRLGDLIGRGIPLKRSSEATPITIYAYKNIYIYINM